MNISLGVLISLERSDPLCSLISAQSSFLLLAATGASGGLGLRLGGEGCSCADMDMADGGEPEVEDTSVGRSVGGNEIDTEVAGEFYPISMAPLLM